ncbi:alpha-L-fucosidase [candidate division KSB1 bacterium]|nr:alpha-L-fucosidase [candidate division KSB1 bacterium]
MKYFVILFIIIIIVTLLSILLSCSRKQMQPVDKMQWWREARFGLFIHWGLYAIPAGEWKGERIPGISEWIMLRGKIPVKDYEALAGQFNPVKYDADAWVRLAKEAGMKYIVITSKHHDGFAMFHSKASPYNIVDATLFKRDVLKELADACQKHGMKLGFYHSQAQDWYHPGGTYAGYDRNEPHWDSTLQRVPFEQYIEEKVVPQVTEILTNYGEIPILWWDTPIGMTEPMAEKLIKLLDLQPGIIANNRLYRPWKGDFSTPEQHIPPTGLDYDWETCMTMNTSWGYKWYDDDWKSTETLIQNLVDIASKGGNYLLNVGPTAEGEFPQPSIERLKAIGAWMKVNGESIYGTTASPFFKLFWGRCTKKVHDNGTTLYLHVFDWPESGKLEVPGLKNAIKSAKMLASGEKLNVTADLSGVVVELPTNAPDPINSVIDLEVEGELQVESNMPAQTGDGSITLPALMADIHNRGYGIHAKLSGKGDTAFISNWQEEKSRIEWMFRLDKPGKFNIEAELSSAADAQMNVKCGEVKIEVLLKGTGNLPSFKNIKLGQISLEKPGNNLLEISPVEGKWQDVNLKTIRLVLIQE